MENNKNLCVFFVVVVLYALFVMHLAADSNWHTFSLLFSSPIGDIASFFSATLLLENQSIAITIHSHDFD